MSAYKIITDSGCDLPNTMLQELDLIAIPLTLNFRGESRPDSVDDHIQELYQGLRDGETATTSAVNPQQWESTIEPVLAAGQDALVIPFSSGLSTTYQSAVIAAGELEEKYPEYLTSYELVMNRTKAHRFNMMIMKKELFHDYCQWLFDILFTLENKLDISNYSAYNQRIFGFISERLLDVYLEANHIAYKELPFMFMEQEHWITKGFSFLKRKFLH